MMCACVLFLKGKITMSSNHIALIPTYEPDTHFPTLLANILSAGFDIIIVDDGSGSTYSNIFEEAKAFGTVLSHPINQGKGAALKTGFAYIQKHFPKDSIIVTIDADGQHRIEDALSLCELAALHPDALILGSRELKNNVPLKSQFGNTLTRILYRLSTGVKIHDTQTGLRAFSMQLLPELLSIPGNRYEYEMNVLLEFPRKNIAIFEKEIATIYLDNNAASHFNVIKDSYRVYKEIIKFSVSSFIGFLVDYFLYGILLLITSVLDPCISLRISNIGARIVSASVNYTVNRKFVFQSKNNIITSAIKYFLLALSILLCNTLILEVLVNNIGLHQMLAKIITELICFSFSWFAQKLFIFKKNLGVKL